MPKTIISADSHITEPPGCYVDRIDHKYKDTAPHMVHDDKAGDIFVVEGMKKPIPMGLVAAAGQDAKDLKMFGAKFEDLHRGGWDPEARMADQKRDGVDAEVIYPTVGMMLCNHPDYDYKKACFDAYNLWIAEYCAAHPDRLLGLGQTAMRSVEEGIDDVRKMKELGLRGVMLPGNPQVSDYDDPIYDPFWQATVDMDMPISFHILTSKSDGFKTRGPRINGFLSIIRGNQDLIGMFIYGGVFQRNPKLKLVCVEADAGWVPHFMYRADHAYKRHRAWMMKSELEKMPSDYFREHVYTTFQDDYIAFQMKDMCNTKRLMWANDFPHSDSTWPWSQEVLAEQTKNLTAQEKDDILHDNVAELYHMSI
ncbi:MAG TPA: amidohydrolase family protein [Candidatus Binataceae bacterium]|nr:amidohydrolase family protein [Candidatus Binataceae bacterium]